MHSAERKSSKQRQSQNTMFFFQLHSDFKILKISSQTVFPNSFNFTFLLPVRINSPKGIQALKIKFQVVQCKTSVPKKLFFLIKISAKYNETKSAFTLLKGWVSQLFWCFIKNSGFFRHSVLKIKRTIVCIKHQKINFMY